MVPDYLSEATPMVVLTSHAGLASAAFFDDQFSPRLPVTGH